MTRGCYRNQSPITTVTAKLQAQLRKNDAASPDKPLSVLKTPSTLDRKHLRLWPWLAAPQVGACTTDTPAPPETSLGRRSSCITATAASPMSRRRSPIPPFMAASLGLRTGLATDGLAEFPSLAARAELSGSTGARLRKGNGPQTVARTSAPRAMNRTARASLKAARCAVRNAPIRSERTPK